MNRGFLLMTVSLLFMASDLVCANDIPILKTAERPLWTLQTQIREPGGRRWCLWESGQGGSIAQAKTRARSDAQEQLRLAVGGVVITSQKLVESSQTDKDGIQIMKGYMASGSFARGREQMEASASMVFIGNINQSVESLVKTSHLLAQFPAAMVDAAFFDRFHTDIPGWEIPKMRPEFFTSRYGLIVDYLAEFYREMRKRSFADAIDRHFKFGSNLNQRDVIAGRKTVSGQLKLLYPQGEFDKEAVRQCLEYALEVRHSVKEQLKKIGGMKFYDVHFSYIDNESLEEHFVTEKEQGGGKLISEGPSKPGVVNLVSVSAKGVPSLYRIELQVTKGTGKLATSGLWGLPPLREQLKMAFDYFKANITRISGASRVLEHDFHLHLVDLQNGGPSNHWHYPVWSPLPLASWLGQHMHNLWCLGI